MKTITSIKDPLILAARKLNKPAERDTHCLLEGETAIRWAIDAGIAILHVFVQKKHDHSSCLEHLDDLNIPLYACSDGIMKKITDSKYFVPIVAVAKISHQTNAKNAPFLLVLDNLQDQGNIGTIIRTASAFGINHFLTAGKSRDIFNKKTITASRGSVFYAHHQKTDDLTQSILQLKRNGYQVIATSPHTHILQSGIELSTKPIALVLGNEAAGISEPVLKEADFVVKIPMSDQVESLNVGVSAGISIYELRIKGLIAMLSKNIRATLGRELGVADYLFSKIFDQALKKSSDYTSQQVILMMIMVCDEQMSRKQIETDMRCDGNKLDTLLDPLLSQNFIAQKEFRYRVTPEGESFLANIWHVIENVEHQILKGFSETEKSKLFEFLQRVQKNAEILLDAD